jgi:DNA-directed RNA polymerase subunit RPC12/RpoP
LKQALLSLATIAFAGGVFLLLRASAVTVALALGVGALLLPMVWLIVSALRPALPDRRCPACGAESLRLMAPGEKIGARCPACGFRDPELYVPYLIDVDDAL